MRNHFLNCNFSLTSFAKDLPDTGGTETREGEETVCCFPYTFGDNGPCWSVIYFLYRKLRGRESIQWKRKKENPKHIFLITGIKCRLPERPLDNVLPLHLINELGNSRTFACKAHHKRAHFFENRKDLILKQKITWCSGVRRGPPTTQLLVFTAFGLLGPCAPCHPLSLAPLSYSTHFLLEFVSFRKGKKWDTNASFIACYFGRYLRLFVTLIPFKLFFHANVCSLPNFGHFVAMSFYRTRPKIGASVTEWQFASQMPLIVLHPILCHQRTVAACAAGKESFSCFWQVPPWVRWPPHPLIMVKCPGVTTPEHRWSFYS